MKFVFVPMFGDLFLMQQTKGKRSGESGFRPHVWGSFFMNTIEAHFLKYPNSFSSPCLGIFFYQKSSLFVVIGSSILFSSPCLGIFFYARLKVTWNGHVARVFVPMFGDLFLWSYD